MKSSTCVSGTLNQRAVFRFVLAAAALNTVVLGKATEARLRYR